MAGIVREYSNYSLKSNPLTTTTITLLFAAVFFPLFLSTLLIWLPFRLLIIALVPKLGPKLEPLEAGATIICAVQSTSRRPHSNMVYHLVCQGSFSLDQLRNQFRHKVLELRDSKGDDIYRRLRCFYRPFCQVLFWQEDSQFDLKNHIRIYDFNEDELTLPPDSVTEDDLMRVTGPLVSRPYAAERSPWELLLTENFKGKNGENLAVITLRMHHAIADGLSCIGLIHRLFGASPPPPLAKFPQLTLKDRISRAVLVIFRAPYELSRLALDFDDELNEWKLPRKSYGDGNFSFCSDPIPWSKIKTIMKKFEVNSNAAIYSIIAGAIVRLMKQGGQQVPGKLSAFTSYPLPNHPGGLQNHATSACFGFNPHTHIGPALLQHVGSQVKAASYFYPLPILMDCMIKLQTLFPIVIIKLMLAPLQLSTFLFTHFPGPLQELRDPDFAHLLDIIPAVEPAGVGNAQTQSIYAKMKVISSQIT